ncbi:hypothetical protein QYS62_008947 [Fusarium acuminatum]|uniref:Uncharacterized protein n=1 Tax=Fusarium acuminatum TaxID=5515 RepID=A0ABZ2X461_9HYPO
MNIMNDWRQIPPPQREIFNLDDIRDQTNHFLNVVARTGLISFSLQVYQLPGQSICRYHLYFDLNESLQFRDSQGDVASIHALAMWMEPLDDGLMAELSIRMVIKHRPFMHPLASFEFPLKNAGRPYCQNLNLIDIINTLQGSAAELPDTERANLLRFKFWITQDGLRGYRDVLTQWMIRLNNTEIVGWFCFNQSIEDAWYEDPEDVLKDITFGSIIAAALTSDQTKDLEDMITVQIARIPIRRGLWLDRNFIRTTFQHGERLPYEGPYEWPLMDLHQANEE